mgnify:CR=1 FL=1
MASSEERLKILKLIEENKITPEEGIRLLQALEKGSPENPAVSKISVHHYSKMVSGSPLKRPAWFFDVDQQGEGIVDVTTHLIDLVQWECFPNKIIDYTKDIEMISAKRWTTEITPSQFEEVTKLKERAGVVRVQLSGAFEVLDGLGSIALLEQNAAELEVILAAMAALIFEFRQQRAGVLEVPLLAKDGDLLKVDLARGVTGLLRSLECLQRFGKLPQRKQGLSQVKHC